VLTEAYYRFIGPRQCVPRDPELAIGRQDALAAIDHLVDTSPQYVFFDLETTGLDWTTPNHIVTTLGVSTPDTCIGIDLMDVTFDEQMRLWEWLGQQKLGGFNLTFDMAWPWRAWDPHTGLCDPHVADKTIYSDALLWFRLLATEAHFNQRFNLETAIEKILGWPDANKQKDWLTGVLNKYQLKKSQMHQLAILEPIEYTRYCAMDAEASMQLHFAMMDTLDTHDFGGLRQYDKKILTTKIRQSIESQAIGLPIDRDILSNNINYVSRQTFKLESKILEHPTIEPHIEEYYENKLVSTYEMVLKPKFIKAKKTDKPWLDPDMWRFRIATDGTKLQRWQQEFGGYFYRIEPRFTIRGENKPWPRFNINSPKDARWLLYEKLLDSEYDIWYFDDNNPNRGGIITIRYEQREYRIMTTKSGALPVGGDILMALGEPGKLLLEYKKLQKLGRDFLNKLDTASRRTGRAHQSTTVLGTVTGRQSGKSSE
jgi:DNA polymerase I-like protein with 3'-5' exonuclease and polymerase domains